MEVYAALKAQELENQGGGGDEDVAVQHRVGKADALHQRAEKAELHEDQHIGEGNAGECRGQAPLVVHELQPADGQPAEQPGEHGSEQGGEQGSEQESEQRRLLR